MNNFVTGRPFHRVRNTKRLNAVEVAAPVEERKARPSEERLRELLDESIRSEEQARAGAGRPDTGDYWWQRY